MHSSPYGPAGGDLLGTFPNPRLRPTGITPGAYTNVNITVDATGRITSISNGSGGSGGVVFTFSATAPASPAVGDQWVDANSGIEYQWINDGTSTQWVEF